MSEEQKTGKEEVSGKRLSTGPGVPKTVMPIHVALSKGVLVVDESICTGCQNCMYACTLTRDGVACPELARIQLNTRWINQPHVAAQPCHQCIDPQCMRYCPTKAIKVDEITGARVIDEALCIGCQTCIEACPYEIPRVRFDRVKKKATKCDLCGGDPACVKACPTGALTYYTNPDGVRCGYVQPKGSDR